MAILTRLTAAAAVAAAVLTGTADAWWCTPHMIIAEIARQNLDAGVETEINKYITFMHEHGPFPQSPDMTQAACWADDLKSDGLEVMKEWHFINQPFNPTNVPLPKSSELQKDNVVNDVTSLQQTLQSHRTTKGKTWNYAFALLNLLHFYGDVHQPLHVAELYDAHFPNGDRGATLFPVTLDGVAWKLHFIWDSVCGRYQQELERPLSNANAALIQGEARRYMANVTLPASEKAQWNATVMAQEGLQFAAKYAYAGLQPGDAITPAYVARCLPAAATRMVQAGFRLASELNYLFGSRHDEGRLAEIEQRLGDRRRDLKARLATPRN